MPRKPGPRCQVVTRREADGTSTVFLVDPRTGRRCPAGSKVPPHFLALHVEQVRRQLLRSGSRPEHAEG